MRYLFIILTSLVVLSCGETRYTPPPDLDMSYYPIDRSDVRVYRMDSVIYDPVGAGVLRIMRTRYQRESIERIDTIGSRIEYILRIEQSPSIDTPQWQTLRFDRAYVEDFRVFRSIENLLFNPLQLPVTVPSSWDGLAFISEDIEAIVAGESVRLYRDWGDYEIRSEAMSRVVDGATYSDVVQVIEADFDDRVLQLRESMSWYARDVGLVERRQRIFDLSCSGAGTGDPCRDNTVPWEEEAESGFSLVQTLLAE